MTHYFLFAGEASGDLHGSSLLEILPSSSTFSGVGGPLMRNKQFHCVEPMESFQVMGFTDVCKALPRLISLFKEIQNHIFTLQPDIIILIDYPGFNLRLAKALRKKGYKGKIVQYICPTVWAHGRKRIQALASNYDLLVTIFPFEASYFSHTSLPVIYAGHPLIDQIQQTIYEEYWWKKYGLESKEKIIALFPGSRLGEIKQHIFTQLEVVKQLKKIDSTLQFVLSCSHPNLEQEILQAIYKNQLVINKDVFVIPSADTRNLMKDAYLALAKSGTVTVELALYQVPTIVHYKLSILNSWIAKYILRLQLPYYCIVNILGKKEIFPEYIGTSDSTKEIISALLEQHQHLMKREKIKIECENITLSLKNTDSKKNLLEAISFDYFS